MIKTLAKSIREYKKTTILAIIFIIIEVIMEVIIPFIMAILLDKGVDAGNMDVITNCGVILIVIALVSLACGAIAGLYSAKASCGFGKNLRKDMYYKVQDYSFNNIDKFSTSSIITRLTTDVSNVQNSFQMIIRIAIRAPLMLLFSLIMAFTINAKISLIFLALLPILAFFLYLIVNKAHPLFEDVFKTYDDMNNGVQENVRGIRVVKSFVKEEYEKKKFAKISQKIYDKFVNAEKIVSWNAPLMSLSMHITTLLLAWFGSRMIVGGSLTTGELTSLISYGTAILTSLMMVSMIYVMLIISYASSERIYEILKEEPSIKNPENPIYEVKDGSIEFKGVSFSYINDLKKLSLKNINLKIKSGDTIGIIGSTGSSKSTLVNLISRLYDVTKGELLVGGTNVKEYDLNVLRDNVSVVLQKNVLFSGTIADNLRWGNKEATKEEMINACKAACAMEFINDFPDGLETKIEQGGTNVSGGQKQRLCIARALLKKPKILILDDSTSAVDTATDARIREAFDKYIPEVTTIIIAQRISSLEHADKVIVLDNGKIDAFDSPKNLIKNNKIYQEVYYSQTRGSDNNGGN